METRIGPTAGLAIGGPVVMGAVLGMPLGASGMLTQATALPAILFGVALLTAPALYIATSLLGIAPPARDSLAAGVRAMRAAGLVMLGLAAPAAFLLATTAAPDDVNAVRGVSMHAGIRIFAMAVVGGAALIAFRKAYRDLFSSDPRCRKCEMPGTGDGIFCAKCGATYGRRPQDQITAFVVFSSWALMTSLMGAKLLIDSFS